MSAAQFDAGLPPKASCDKADPHFAKDAYKLSDRIDIFVDGVLIDEAVGWDVAAGEVRVPARFDDGTPICDPRGVQARTTLKGRVEVRWIKTAGAA